MNQITSTEMTSNPTQAQSEQASAVLQSSTILVAIPIEYLREVVTKRGVHYVLNCPAPYEGWQYNLWDPTAESTDKIKMVELNTTNKKGQPSYVTLQRISKDEGGSYRRDVAGNLIRERLQVLATDFAQFIQSINWSEQKKIWVNGYFDIPQEKIKTIDYVTPSGNSASFYAVKCPAPYEGWELVLSRLFKSNFPGFSRASIALKDPQKQERDVKLRRIARDENGRVLEDDKGKIINEERNVRAIEFYNNLKNADWSSVESPKSSNNQESSWSSNNVSYSPISVPAAPQTGANEDGSIPF